MEMNSPGLKATEKIEFLLFPALKGGAIQGGAIQCKFH